MKGIQQGAGKPIRKIDGREKLIRLVKGNCPSHGDVMVRLFRDGRVECPKCVKNRTRIDAVETGIPLRFISKGLDEFIVEDEGQAKASKTARGYADKFDEALRAGAGLVFIGDVGTGKTHLACAIGNHVRTMGKSVYYTTARNALDALKDTWRRDSDKTKGQVLRRYTTPELLILDEVGVQFGTETERGLIYDIIDGRYGQLRPSIIISNLNWVKLAELIGHRVADRMREGGELVEFGWESYRK